jgi:predicted transcriptional regulator YheO
MQLLMSTREIKMSKIDKFLKPHQKFIDAIVTLFDPFVEVAVHDLQKGTLAAIYNSFSKRKIGEKSPLKELKVSIEDFPDVFTPYNRRNWDGKELKCTSITLRDKAGNPAVLICLNFDTSLLVKTKDILEAFLKIKTESVNPIEAYGEGYEEQINSLIEHFLKERQISMSSLDRNSKNELIEFLYRKGVFHFKNSVPFIAKSLKLSRASIYNYIKEVGASS